MSGIVFLSLILVLTACAAPGQATQENRLPPATPTQSRAHSTAAPVPGSSVLLTLNNTSENRYEIHLVDSATGQDVPGYTPITLGGSSYTPSYFLSTDGKKLMAIESRGQSCEFIAGGTACRGSADVLHLVDLLDWREVTTKLPGKGWVGPLAFSPDTTRLALAYHARASSTLMLFDAGRGNIVTQRALPFRPSLIGYTQDGTTLVVYGQSLGSNPGMSKPDPPRVMLVNATTLETMWDQTLDNIVSGSWCLENCQASHEQRLFASWTPAVVLSPDGRKLYIVHADEERLTKVELTVRTVRTVEIQVALSWFERFLALTAGVAEAKGGTQGTFKIAVLSPDGTRLYVIGQATNFTRDAQGDWQTTWVYLGLQVIDVESGRRKANLDSEASWIRITPDGAYLLLDGWGERERWTEVLDANSLQSVARLTEWGVVATRRMDGQPIILASQPTQQRTQLAVLDSRSFDVIHSWSENSYASWATTP